MCDTVEFMEGDKQLFKAGRRVLCEMISKHYSIKGLGYFNCWKAVLQYSCSSGRLRFGNLGT